MRELDGFELLKSTLLQLRRRTLDIADEHDGQPIGSQIGLGDALDVSTVTAFTRSRKVCKILDGQPVEHDTLSTCMAIASAFRS